jgi:hypothetical protein
MDIPFNYNANRQWIGAGSTCQTKVLKPEKQFLIPRSQCPQWGIFPGKSREIEIGGRKNPRFKAIAIQNPKGGRRSG